MMRLVLLALLAVLLGCPVSDRARTQLVVSVAAHPQLAPRLQALQVSIYDAEDRDEHTPRKRERIVIANTPAGALPLSFSITRNTADRFRLMISGCADASCTQLLVSQKLLVRFIPDQTSHLSVVLLPDCIDATCVGLDSTCEGGTCRPLEETAGTVIVPGTESAPTIPIDDDRTIDAGTTTAIDASTPRQCPADQTCQTAIYPCVPDDGDGYTCLGQLADWSMPDSLADGGVRPAYQVIGDEVTRDLVTQLEWQRNALPPYIGCTGDFTEPGDTCTWQEARDYCGQLGVAGGGWRLPSKIELESLLDFDRTVPTLDPTYFFATSYAQAYWSSSPSAVDTASAYSVSMSLGYTLIDPKAKKLYVRCVRSLPRVLPHVTKRLSAVEDGVADARTKLTWNKRVPCYPELDHAGAAQFCAEIVGGWRMPTAKEVLTLIDPTHPTSNRQPAIPSIISDNLTSASAHAFFVTSTPSKAHDTRMVVEAAYGQALDENLARLRAEHNGWTPSYCWQCVR
jgi:hypothetical protein